MRNESRWEAFGLPEIAIKSRKTNACSSFGFNTIPDNFRQSKLMENDHMINMSSFQIQVRVSFRIFFLLRRSPGTNERLSFFVSPSNRLTLQYKILITHPLGLHLASNSALESPSAPVFRSNCRMLPCRGPPPLCWDG